MFEQDRRQILAELRHKMGGGSVSPVMVGSVLAGSTVGSAVAGSPVDGSAVGGSAAVAPAAAGTGAPTGGGTDRPVLVVPEPLAGILPRGGLPRGGVVSLRGEFGATSLLFTLLAAPANIWSALVGMPDVGLLAAAELGVELDRLVLIPDPGPDVLQVLSILADGVDMIAVGPPKMVAPARLRVLNARLRQSGAVLLVTGQWPGADLVLDSRIEGWTGLSRGHGRLRDRELIVEVSGRGAAGRRRSAVMFLQSHRSRVDIAAAPDRRDRGPSAVVAEVG